MFLSPIVAVGYGSEQVLVEDMVTQTLGADFIRLTDFSMKDSSDLFLMACSLTTSAGLAAVLIQLILSR